MSVYDSVDSVIIASPSRMRVVVTFPKRRFSMPWHEVVLVRQTMQLVLPSAWMPTTTQSTSAVFGEALFRVN